MKTHFTLIEFNRERKNVDVFCREIGKMKWKNIELDNKIHTFAPVELDGSSNNA
jgi:hypothetical protein